MTIHREGYKLLAVAAIVLMAINWVVNQFLSPQVPWATLVLVASIISFLLILQFFRNPSVRTKVDPNSVYAPADGKVVVIEETQESEYFNLPRIQISIFMSPVNVHINRNPVSGKVKMFKYHPGKYLVAWHPKSSTENERTTLVVEKANGVDIMIRQIAGAVARRIKCYIGEGDSIVQGEEFGFIKFGSRVDIFLPLNAHSTVNIGDKTLAGKTIIARFGDQTTASENH